MPFTLVKICQFTFSFSKDVTLLTLLQFLQKLLVIQTPAIQLWGDA